MLHKIQLSGFQHRPGNSLSDQFFKRDQKHIEPYPLKWSDVCRENNYENLPIFNSSFIDYDLESSE